MSMMVYFCLIDKIGKYKHLDKEEQYFGKNSNLSTKLPILACWFVNVSKGDGQYSILFRL